jgi:CheY-like chemotaxis protein
MTSKEISRSGPAEEKNRVPRRVNRIRKSPPEVEGPQVKKIRLLVVDDEGAVQRVIARQLGEENYTIKNADDGQQGLRAFRDGEFDLVITDMYMPNMTGMELLGSILTQQPDAKVIVMSGNLDDSTKRALLDMGAVAILQKPDDVMNKGSITKAIGDALP